MPGIIESFGSANTVMIQRFLSVAVLGALALAAGLSARGFSLLGPFDGYQTTELYYDPNPTIYGDDIGGPQNLGEEYRWNVPNIVYAYDSAFLDYFGQRGVEEIEKAVAIFNALPDVDTLSEDLTEFPLNTQRINHRAAALGMLDLKSSMMVALIELLGLAHPERYVWTLRNRAELPGGCPLYEYRVIKRSFDPVTWLPSSYVNGVLYTYLIQVSCNPTWSDSREFPVDPTAVTHTSLANGYYGMKIGGYYSGLTRDDVGGLRYLYRANNYNVEDIPVGATVGFGPVPQGNSGGGNSGGGIDWVPIAFPSTNALNTNGVTGGGVNQPATLGLRPGVGKLRFIRGEYDSILGPTFRGLTNVYSSIIITNGRAITQSVRRPVLVPDIVISAADLLDGTHARPDPVWITAPTPNGGTVLNGPGVIPTGLSVTFNKVGPRMVNSGPPLIGEPESFPQVVWGSYDGTTNAPTIYPFHTSIKDLERQVLGR